MKSNLHFFNQINNFDWGENEQITWSDRGESPIIEQQNLILNLHLNLKISDNSSVNNNNSVFGDIFWHDWNWYTIVIGSEPRLEIFPLNITYVVAFSFSIWSHGPLMLNNCYRFINPQHSNTISEILKIIFNFQKFDIP